MCSLRAGLLEQRGDNGRASHRFLACAGRGQRFIRTKKKNGIYEIYTLIVSETEHFQPVGRLLGELEEIRSNVFTQILY
jgi:hypothetical protein